MNPFQQRTVIKTVAAGKRIDYDEVCSGFEILSCKLPLDIAVNNGALLRFYTGDAVSLDVKKISISNPNAIDVEIAMTIFLALPKISRTVISKSQSTLLTTFYGSIVPTAGYILTGSGQAFNIGLYNPLVDSAKQQKIRRKSVTFDVDAAGAPLGISGPAFRPTILNFTANHQYARIAAGTVRTIETDSDMSLMNWNDLAIFGGNANANVSVTIMELWEIIE